MEVRSVALPSWRRQALSLRVISVLPAPWCRCCYSRPLLLACSGILAWADLIAGAGRRSFEKTQRVCACCLQGEWLISCSSSAARLWPVSLLCASRCRLLASLHDCGRQGLRETAAGPWSFVSGGLSHISWLGHRLIAPRLCLCGGWGLLGGFFGEQYGHQSSQRDSSSILGLHGHGVMLSSRALQGCYALTPAACCTA